MSEEMIDMLMGIDKKHEIIALWYEITFLRHVLNHIASSIPEIKNCITQEALDIARKNSKMEVINKFPNAGVKFTDINPSDKQEGSCCTHQDASESHHVSPSPLNES